MGENANKQNDKNGFHFDAFFQTDRVRPGFFRFIVENNLGRAPGMRQIS